MDDFVRWWLDGGVREEFECTDGVFSWKRFGDVRSSRDRGDECLSTAAGLAKAERSRKKSPTFQAIIFLVSVKP